MVGFSHAEKLPKHRAFGKCPGGWGQGQVVETGDHVRDIELWWTTSNTTKNAQKATWSLGLVIQFVNGQRVVHQDVKMAWLTTTKEMVQRRMATDDIGDDPMAA